VQASYAQRGGAPPGYRLANGYGLPRTDEVYSFEMDENPVPTKTNPMGVKGAGEAGNVRALTAIMMPSPTRSAPAALPTSTCRLHRNGSGVPSAVHPPKHLERPP
jgi:hypothetical protein